MNKYAIYCIIILVSFIGGMFFGKKKELPPIAVQSDVKSSNLSKCIVTKTTDSEGKVIERIEANAQSDSVVSNVLQISPESNSHVDIFFGAGLNTDLKPYGSLEFIFGANALEIKSDFNKDHSLFYKRKILEWR